MADVALKVETKYIPNTRLRLDRDGNIYCWYNVKGWTNINDQLHETNNGYKYIKRGQERFFIHRVVAILFVKGRKSGYVVDHINGNNQDNRADNLQWLKHSDNLKKRKRIYDDQPRTEQVN